MKIGIDNSQIKDPIDKKQSSTNTIFALVNLMVGSVVLLLPINFGRAGLVVSILVLIVMGGIQYLTCTWLIQNKKENENSLEVVIQRLLGIKFRKIFTFNSSLMLSILALIYFKLINSTVWQIIIFILAHSEVRDEAAGKKDEIYFTKYSMQYQACYMVFVLYPMIKFKSEKTVVKLASVGAFSAYIYLIFIAYIFLDGIGDGRIKHNISDANAFSQSVKAIALIIGNFQLAFMPHNAVGPIISQNENQKNNVRDLKYAFIIVMFMYAFIGLFGYFGLLGYEALVDQPSDIYDYFEDKNVLQFLVYLVFLCNLLTVYPLVLFICKKQFFTTFYSEDDYFNQRFPEKYLKIFHYVYHFFAFLFTFLVVNVNYIVGFTSNIIGYYIVFILPSIIYVRQLNKMYKRFKQGKVRLAKDVEQHILKQSQQLQNKDQQKDDNKEDDNKLKISKLQQKSLKEMDRPQAETFCTESLPLISEEIDLTEDQEKQYVNQEKYTTRIWGVLILVIAGFIFGITSIVSVFID